MDECEGSTGLRVVGAWLLGGSALWWVASAVAKEEFFLGDSAREKAAAIAAHPGSFRAFHLLAALGTVAATCGVVLLGRWLRARMPSRLVDVGVAAAVLGTAAWLVEVGVRMTAAVVRAEDVAAGVRGPTDEPSVGNVVLFALSGLAFAAPALMGWLLASRRVPTRRSSLIAAVLLAVVTLGASATFAVSLVYQFGTPALALVLLVVRPKPLTSGADTAVERRDGAMRS